MQDPITNDQRFPIAAPNFFFRAHKLLKQQAARQLLEFHIRLVGVDHGNGFALRRWVAGLLQQAYGLRIEPQIGHKYMACHIRLILVVTS